MIKWRAGGRREGDEDNREEVGGRVGKGRGRGNGAGGEGVGSRALAAPVRQKKPPTKNVISQVYFRATQRHKGMSACDP